jgi:hypothetical protein
MEPGNPLLLHKGLPPVPIPNQMNSVHILTFYFFEEILILSPAYT